MVPVPKPARHISEYQEKIQPNLIDRYLQLQEGLTEVKQPLDKMYTHLSVTAGGDIHINTQHEVMQIETVKPADTETTIEPCDMFKHPSGKDRPIRTVLTKGIAGIGKTFLVHKFVFDWCKRETNKDVHLVFPFTFRELNSWKGEKSSGNTNFDKSEFKLLFVLDGLDESRLDLDCSTNENKAVKIDVTAPTSVDELLTNLIKKKLLPSARIWITTRPAAANQIHSDFVDIVTEVRGFTDPQKEEYFRKRYTDQEQASRIISHIKTSRSLHIMCHIPVFCWITATVLEEVMKTREGGELPKTLTEMYAEFLKFQIHQTKDKYDQKKCIQYIESLAKLAYHQLEKGNLIFYEKDLKESGIDVSGASVFSGVFTEIFKKESRGKNDKNKMFSFVHLSVQEFLAALHVERAVINRNKNVMFGQSLREKGQMVFSKKSMMSKVHRFAIDKALQSPNGHLDLFLRFLLGLSLQTNQDLLKDLHAQTGSSSQTYQDTVEYIKMKISENLSEVKLLSTALKSPHCKLETLREGAARILASDKSLDQNLRSWVFPEASSQLEKVLVVHGFKCSRKVQRDDHRGERGCSSSFKPLNDRNEDRELDLSNNDLHDSGVKLLSGGIKSQHCKLETLSLSGCHITEEGCTSLASALSSNPSHLRGLDLSYNHPGDSGVMLLSDKWVDPHWRLDTLRLDHCGAQRLKPGLRKYSCELTLDTDTAHRNLKLSDNNRKVTAVEEEQPYPDHPERFDDWCQLLCRGGLTGRCYWEVERSGGGVSVAVSYRGIRRRGDSEDCLFGYNDRSWSLICSDGGYSVWHNKRETRLSSSSSSSYSISDRVGVYVDCSAGILSFYTVSYDSLIHLYTFNTTFTEPLYPGFWLGLHGSVSLCSV
ncbi:protein NLRC3-like [Perca flavescens]|uniref:protein NLRC3-like n=1 Tax=Perca flavescens TaxID=8167 RepID=UPI00106E1385|nr:protein NLRC3-like [Perca flavescens]